MSNAQTQEAPQGITIPRYLPWVFFFYSFASGFNSIVLGQMNLFSTEYAGISAASLAAFLSVARIIDFVVSMISGAIVQNSNSRKWGEYRPWILALPTISWIGNVIMFMNPPIPVFGKLVIVCCGYMMQHLPMNFLTVAQNGIQTKVAGPNPLNRMSIASRRVQGSAAARIITSAATLPLIILIWDSGYNGYFIVAIAGGLITFAANFVVFSMTKVYDQYNPDKTLAPKQNLGQMYLDAMKVKDIWVLLIVDVLKSVAGQGAGVCVMYYYRFSAGDVRWQSIAGTISALVSLGASMIMPPVARKLGKKYSHMATGIVLVVVYTLIAFFADGNPIFYVVITSVVNTIGTAILSVWGINLWLDVAEIRQQETGVDNRPFIMSIQNFPIKIGMFVSGPLLPWFLSIGKYEPGVMGDTPSFVRAFGLFAAVIYAVTVVIMGLFYNVDPVKAAEAAAANQATAQARIAAAAAAAGGGAAAPGSAGGSTADAESDDSDDDDE